MPPSMGDSVRAPLQASGERWRLGECGERWRLGEVSWAVGVCSRVVLRTHLKVEMRVDEHLH